MHTTTRPWLQSYPEGVPATIDVETHRSLIDLLDTSFHRHANRQAALFLGQPISFRTIDEQSVAWGPGCSPGDWPAAPAWH